MFEPITVLHPAAQFAFFAFLGVAVVTIGFCFVCFIERSK